MKKKVNDLAPAGRPGPPETKGPRSRDRTGPRDLEGPWSRGPGVPGLNKSKSPGT